MEGSVQERPVGSPTRTSRLSQYWHPIVESSALTDQPQRCTLLGEHLVAFRAPDGVAVFKDLCIHRGTALSLGWARDGRIVCPYHGWEYDRSGACVRIPSLPEGAAVPARARAIAYRAEERYGLVWVAMEDPVAPIPGFPQNEPEEPALRRRGLLGAGVGDLRRPLDRELDGRLALPVRPPEHPRAAGVPAPGPVRPARDGLGPPLPGREPVLPQRRRVVRDHVSYEYYQLVPVLDAHPDPRGR